MTIRSRTGCSCLCIALILGPTGCSRHPEQPARVTIVGLGIQAGEYLQRDELPEFTRSTGIRVDVIPAWGNPVEQLDQAVTLLKKSSDPVDIYGIDIIWTGALAPDLLDLNPYAGQEVAAHLAPLVQNDTVAGRLVSLPFYVSLGVLYYRTDLLKKYGYRNPPGTWDELESMAARIQRGERAAGNVNFWGFVWQGASYEGLTCNALEWQVAYGGGRIIESDASITVNNPGSVAALKKAAGWVGTISPKGVLSYNEADSMAVFRAGNAAFLRHWSGSLNRAKEGSPIYGRYGMTLLPAGPCGRAQSLGGYHLAVSRHSAHARESAQLVVRLTGATVQLRHALDTGILPSITSLYSHPGLIGYLPVAAQLRSEPEDSWVARPSTIAGAKYSEVSKAYYQAVHDILSARTGAGEALPNLEQKLVSITGFRTGSPPQ